jgi:hypothetical protein
MKRTLAFGLAAVLTAQLLAGCGSGVTEENPTLPLPSAVTPYHLATQAAPRTTTCPSTVLPAVKVDWDAGHRVLSMSGEKMIWPFGFSASMLPSGHLEIRAPGGAIVARDGDTLQIGGADYEHVCRIQGVEY